MDSPSEIPEARLVFQHRTHANRKGPLKKIAHMITTQSAESMWTGDTSSTPGPAAPQTVLDVERTAQHQDQDFVAHISITSLHLPPFSTHSRRFRGFRFSYSMYLNQSHFGLLESSCALMYQGQDHLSLTCSIEQSRDIHYNVNGVQKYKDRPQAADENPSKARLFEDGSTASLLASVIPRQRGPCSCIKKN